ncbi:peptidase [Sulfurifustis variabilis]|uniref:Peptidase n=1 Tax=Sulfurifustis variabilis TaxID=1675686 RepID=A0A1B4V285_9GAMM|nr:alpha/beta hydrolase [Sulfurifustis variabilis]BAU47405.1 peptidase [Sulfurifustis variabilis]
METRVRRPHGRLLAILTAWLLGALAAPPGPAFAAEAYGEVPGCIEGSLPAGDPRYPAPQLVVTCVPPPGSPAAWNGTLVVLVHGYVVPQRPLELPVFDLDGLNAARVLLNLGFAFATSSFHKNGYAVEQGGNDIDALVRHFHANVAAARRVLLVGASEGALIATMLVERDPERYAGGLALCGPLGGADFEIRYLGDFRAVFDYFFPQVFDFGVAGVPADAHQNYGGYGALVRDALNGDPARREALFRVTGVARDPDRLAESAVEAALDVLRYNIFGFNDLAETAGGNPYGNVDRAYAGSDNDAALNAGVERLAASSTARAYLDRYYLPTGILARPLVAMHTRLDPHVPFAHHLRYVEAVRASGRAGRLTALAVDRYGHCAFRPGEILGALALLAERTGLLASEALRAYLPEIAPLRRESE